MLETRLRTATLLSLCLAASAPLACTDDGGDDGTSTESTDDPSGDGEPTGDGDGDPSTGDGDGDPTTGDGDPTGDGDGDPGSTGCEGITPAITELTPDELSAMLEAKDFELINVHIPNAGEIPGTDVHIAYTETDMLEAYLGNDVGAKAVLYCRTGPMSAIAGAALIERGYCRIYDMPAGMIGWEAEGYPIDP